MRCSAWGGCSSLNACCAAVCGTLTRLGVGAHGRDCRRPTVVGEVEDGRGSCRIADGGLCGLCGRGFCRILVDKLLCLCAAEAFVGYYALRRMVKSQVLKFHMQRARDQASAGGGGGNVTT